MELLSSDFLAGFSEVAFFSAERRSFLAGVKKSGLMSSSAVRMLLYGSYASSLFLSEFAIYKVLYTVYNYFACDFFMIMLN